MKKLFLFLILLCEILCPKFCLAAGQISVKLGSDYLIMSDDCVKNTLLSNPEILSLSPFFTIFNEKNTLLLHPMKQGSSDVTILFDKTYDSFKIQVLPKTSKLPDKTVKMDGLEILLLDSMPVHEEFDIDQPPNIKE